MLLALSLLVITGLFACRVMLHCTTFLGKWGALALAAAFLFDVFISLVTRRFTLAEIRRLHHSDLAQADAEEYAAHHLLLRSLLSGIGVLYFGSQFWRLAVS